MDDQPTLLGGPDAQDRDPGNHNDFLKVIFLSLQGILFRLELPSD